MSSIRITHEAGVRYLQFDSRWIQGAMRLARPWALEIDYTREMMMALLMRPDRGWPRSVLQIGLGAASITRFLHRNLPKAKLEVVEIDPEVVLNAWQFFRLPEESARLRIELGDGYNYMVTTRKRFDLILVDGFDARGRAGRLHSLPFYRLCRTRLSDGGMMVTNLLSRRKRTKANADPIRKVFDDRVLVLPPCDANTVVVAKVGASIRLTVDEFRASARKLKTRTDLNLLPTVTRLAKRLGEEDRIVI
jgi:spermidine synthase